MASALVTAVPASTVANPRIRLLALAAAPMLAIGGTTYVVANRGVSPGLIPVLLVAGSYIAVGFFAWFRQPDNRIGPLMTGLGVSFLLLLFGGGPIPWFAALMLLGFTLQGGLLAYLILAYPSGRLGTTLNRRIVGVTTAVLGVSRLLVVISQDPTTAGGPANPYLLIRDHEFVRLYEPVPYYVDIVVLSVFIVIVIARWIRATGPARRIYTPVAIPVLAILTLILAETILSFTTLPPDIDQLLGDAAVVGRIAFPIGFLIGLMRMRMARSAVADLVVELGDAPAPERLREALANALGDRTLAVAYWSPVAGAYVDPLSTPVAMPADGSGRAVTFLARGGEPLAAIIHDAALLNDPGLVPSVASAMRLAVENERLQGEVELQLGEVRASRARIVAAGDAERKRVERDLHDGAQQRLVSLSLALRLAKTRLGDDADPAVRASLDQASDEARAALSELRELARGIHPQILTEAGLGPAIESLGDRSPIDVDVQVGSARYSPAVEGAAYFVVSEGLANVAKYAHADNALVRTSTHDGQLILEISDDGVGGADPASGSGLRGLADRLSAIDGTLEIVSPRGGGTRLVARIPIPMSSPVQVAG